MSNTKNIQLQALRNRITKSSITILILSIISAPIGYFIRMLLSRSLTQVEFGLFYSVLALFAFLGNYNDLGFGFSVSYLVPKFNNKANFQKLWNTFFYNFAIEVTTSVLLGLLLLLFGNWVALNYFKTDAAISILRIGVILFVFQSFISALRKFFIGMELEKIYGSIDLITQIIAFIIIGLSFVLVNSADVAFYFLEWTLAFILTATILFVFFLKKFAGGIVLPTFDKKLLRQMFLFAIPTLLSTSVENVTRYISIFLLTLYSGLISVGAYNVIFPIIGITQIFLSPVGRSFFPIISGLSDNSKLQIGLITEKLLKIVPTFGLYFGIFIFLFPEAIVQTLFGSKWMHLTALPLRIISLSFVFNLTSGFLGVVASGLGLVKEKLYISIFISLTTLLLGIILVSRYDLIGAVLVASISFMINFLLQLYLIKKKVRFNVPIKYYLFLLFLVLFFYVFKRVLGLHLHGILEIFTAGFIYSLIFALSVFMNKDLRADLMFTLKFVLPAKQLQKDKK